MTTKLIDLSHWENPSDINYDKVKADGVTGMITKAADIDMGLGGGIDPTLHGHIAKARAEGFAVGAYIFMRNADPQKQFDLYMKAISGLNLKIGILDLEEAAGPAGATLRNIAVQIRDMMKAAFGRPPILYGDSSYLAEMNLDSSWAECQLWLANYNKFPNNIVPAKSIPKPYQPPGPGVTIYQFTDRGEAHIAQPNGCDTDIFYGTPEQLMELLGG